MEAKELYENRAVRFRCGKEGKPSIETASTEINMAHLKDQKVLVAVRYASVE